jgi:hypothetical protein
MAVWKFKTSWLLLLVCVLGAGMPMRAFSLEDLNREFTDNFFRLGAADGDASLRVTKSEAQPDEGLGAAEKGDEGKGVESKDPSWVGKFLQLAIVFLLGIIVYLLSRKKRATRAHKMRGRY